MRKLRGLVLWAIVGYAVCMAGTHALLLLFGDDWVPASILLFLPRWPLVLPGLVLMVVGALLRKWTWTAGATLASIYALLGPAGFVVSLPSPCSACGPRLRVVSYNAGGGGIEGVQRLMNSDVDVLILTEAGHICDNDEAVKPMYVSRGPHVCILSRIPPKSSDARDPADFFKRAGMGVMVTAVFEQKGARYAVTGLHLETPREAFQQMIFLAPDAMDVYRDKQQLRSEESATARAWVDRRAIPHLVGGDFNYPQESIFFQRDWKGFRDAFASAGFGFGYTKRTRRLGTRIDHVLASEHWCIESARVLDGFSGDHSPLLAELQLR